MFVKTSNVTSSHQTHALAPWGLELATSCQHSDNVMYTGRPQQDGHQLCCEIPSKVYFQWWIQGDARDVRPPRTPNSFISMQFSVISWRTPWEIGVPPEIINQLQISSLLLLIFYLIVSSSIWALCCLEFIPCNPCKSHPKINVVSSEILEFNNDFMLPLKVRKERKVEFNLKNIA